MFFESSLGSQKRLFVIPRLQNDQPYCQVYAKVSKHLQGLYIKYLSSPQEEVLQKSISGWLSSRA